jgi:hypothetical protein
MRILILLVIVAVFTGCNDSQSPKVITETRMLSPSETPVSGQSSGASAAQNTEPTDETPRTSSFRWEIPEGWQEGTPTPIRMANFLVAGHPDMECYLAVLVGAAGGVEANVNRWRRQMGQPDLAPEEIASLESMEMLGSSSFYIEIEGDFEDMTGQSKPGYRMLAVICPLPDKTVFVKMTGPAEAVLKEKAHFMEFCATLKEEGKDTDADTKENQ